MDELKRNDEVFRLLGEFVVEISALDAGLSHLFEAITGLNPGHAADIYLSQDASAARRSMVNAAAESMLTAEDELAWYKSISEAHADLMARRNRLFHDLWVYDENTGELQIFDMKRRKRLLRPNAPKPASAAELTHEIGRAKELLAEMKALHRLLIERRLASQ